MKPINEKIWFPSVGQRSPVVKIYAGNLKRAYYFTNGLIFLAIVMIFGYVRYQQVQYEQRLKNIDKNRSHKIIYLDPAKIGPPPSIYGDGNGGTNVGALGNRATAPAVGVPKPVPDDQATQQTTPNQQDISGTNVFGADSGSGTGVIIQVRDIPDINAFVPHEIEPLLISRPALVYPEIARLTDQEGTVSIKALVDLDGSVMRVVVTKSSGFPVLDTAAVEYTYQWKLKPALQNEKPVRVWVGSPVRFQLK